MYKACEKGDIEIVQLLIDTPGVYHVDQFMAVRRKISPVYQASYWGKLQVVSFLIKRGASINIAAEWRDTPLHIACHNGHLEVAKLLLKHGAEIDALRWDQYTPLHKACAHTHSVFRQ